MRFAFLTCERFAALYEDELPVVAELASRGVAVEPVVWTQATRESLERFDAVVMRTPWDWYSHRARFRAFLAELSALDAPVLNPPHVLQGFADKSYLPRLEAAGVAVVPTVELAPTERHRVPELLSQRRWTRAVLKPAFTANAVGAVRIDASQVEAALASIAGTHEPYLLQPFVEGIAQGELSFVFFDGAFSHAVKKLPKAGEWRVQHEYGGVPTRVEPAVEDVAQAEALLRLAAPDTAYARVDCVRFEGRLCLMELEVVEPELFVRLHPDAPRRFAEALVSRLEAR